jgi:7-cyano-7-deazaguanine synthase in queuosine biosynthesis
MLKDSCIIAMVSGGLDSVAMLYQLLKKNHNEDVIVHYVNLLNAENRHRIESYCAHKCFDYLKTHVKNFQVTTSTLDLTGLFDFGYDFIHVMYIAGLVYKSHCRDYANIKIACGRTKGDLEAYSAESAHYARLVTWVSPVSHLALSVSCSKTKDANEIYKFPAVMYPVAHKTKKELKDSIPEELFDLTWSCRAPKYTNNVVSNCGRCITCKDMRHAGIYKDKLVKLADTH